MKYVKKPVVVEAFQFGIDEKPDWFIQTSHYDRRDHYNMKMKAMKVSDLLSHKGITKAL